MRIAICDDEAFYRAQIIKLIDEYSKTHSTTDISFSEFSHGDDLMEAAEQSGGFDIYILDIMMPNINGIELGVLLRESGYDGKIIYLTSSMEHAIDSYKVKAFNYILKPFKKDSFLYALDEVIASVASQPTKSFLVKTKDCTVKVIYDDIMYAELYRRVITYHLIDGTSIDSLMIRTSFPIAIQELLDDERFVLCGSSKAVNLQHITRLESDSVLLNNTYPLHLPKKALRDIQTTWTEYNLKKENSK